MPAARRPRSLTYAALFLITALAITGALQWQGGAYTADLSANPDEAAHFVTGLMVRDYLLQFPWPAPMVFAQSFYDHYPMVAIGHWPPLFYLVQAVWMAMLGGSVASALALMAVVTAATAATLLRAAQPLVGVMMAAVLSVVFLIVPLAQQYSRSVMAEMPLTLLALLSALAYARYLSTERAGSAVWFGIAASAAILTKPNGLALALLPPIAVVLARQTRLVAERSFWIPAAIVLLVCGPWYAATFQLAREGWSASYNPVWVLRYPVASNAIDALALTGTPIFVLACAGAAVALIGRNELRSDPTRRCLAASMAALALSTWIFISVVVPVRGNRHSLPLLPPILVFAAVAIQRIAGANQPRWRGALAAAVAIVAVAPLAIRAIHLPTKINAGSAAVVSPIKSDRELDNRAILVSSEGYGEGTFIAALAASDTRPQHQVLRASKVLSTSSWSGSDYRLLYSSPDEVDAALRRLGVEAIVLDTRPVAASHAAHHRQLIEMLSRHRDRWQALAPGAASSFTVFRALHDRR